MVADEIDAHVRVVDCAKAQHEGEQRRMQVPLELLQQGGFEVAADVRLQPDLQAVDIAVGGAEGKLAGHHVEDRDEDERYDEPRSPSADEINEAAQRIAGLEWCWLVT